MHGICGTGIGVEGSGQRRVCSVCMQRQQQLQRPCPPQAVQPTQLQQQVQQTLAQQQQPPTDTEDLIFVDTDDVELVGEDAEHPKDSHKNY